MANAYRTTHTANVQEQILMDGSSVYSVELCEYAPHESASRLVFDAVDRNAAFQLAEQLALLLNNPRLVLASVETHDHTRP